MDFNDFDNFTNNTNGDNDPTSLGMSGNFNSNPKKSFDVVTLIISIIGGIAGYFASGFIYQMIQEDLWSPLAIGIAFVVFYLVVALVVFVYSCINGNQANSSGMPKNIIFMIIALVVVLISGTFFEYIYEMNFFGGGSVYMKPTSYVFILDNSDSMNSSDPDDLKYEAIDDIISSQNDDFPYAIYSFNDTMTCQREMAPKSQGVGKIDSENSGQTYIKTTLEKLLKEFDNGNIKGAGDAPKFLLLSDGAASDIGSYSDMNSVLNDYSEHSIAISTVGLGNADDELLQQIANRTGGVYIGIDEADQLENAMATAITKTSDRYNRTFFTYRYVPSMDFLYAIMRIVFTAIVGFVISASMLFATGKEDDGSLIIISSLITSVLAGFILELGINMFELDSEIMTIAYMLLVAATFINNVLARVFNNNFNMYTGSEYQSVNNDKSIGSSSNYNTGDKNLRF